MANVHVDPSARLNVPLRMLQGGVWSSSNAVHRPPIVLPDTVYIGPFASIGCGVKLGHAVVVDSYCSIDPDTSIGARTIIIYRASIGGGTTIGEDCVIGGFIPENTLIGDRSRVLGTLLHSHRDPGMSWDHHEVPEVSPTVEEDVFVGIAAKVIGPVTLHRNCYIASGAIVTRSVPTNHVAFGVNRFVHRRDWRGELQSSPFFKAD